MDDKAGRRWSASALGETRTEVQPRLQSDSSRWGDRTSPTCSSHSQTIASRFGIRCTVCSEAHKAGIIKRKRWTDYTYKGSMRQGVRQIQVEDLRMHIYRELSAKGNKVYVRLMRLSLLTPALSTSPPTRHLPSQRRRPRSLETSTLHVQSRSRL